MASGPCSYDWLQFLLCAMVVCFLVVLDTPLYAADSHRYLRDVFCVVCWCISTTVVWFSEAVSRLWRLVLYAENAFDKAAIVCHRVRARSSYFLRGAPLMHPHGVVFSGVFVAYERFRK